VDDGTDISSSLINCRLWFIDRLHQTSDLRLQRRPAVSLRPHGVLVLVDSSGGEAQRPEALSGVQVEGSRRLTSLLAVHKLLQYHVVCALEVCVRAKELSDKDTNELRIPSYYKA